MTQYSSDLSRRFGVTMVKLQQDVKKLKTRTAGIDSGFPLANLPAQIDPDYTSGDAQVYVNGSATLSGPYACLSSYTPVAGASVLITPVPALRTYVIIGSYS